MKKVVCLSLAGVLLFNFAGVTKGIASVDKSANTRTGDSLNVNLEVNYSPIWFEWKEYNEGRSLKEDGWIHRTSISVTVEKNRFFVVPEFNLYAGSIDYKGQTITGTKVSTDTSYYGFEISAKGGYSFCLGKAEIPAYIGLGYERWRRNLESTLNAFGYAEKWSQLYTIIGVAPQWHIGKRYYIFGDLYIKRPLDIKNKVSYFDVTVDPEEVWNYGIELGVGVKPLLKRYIEGKISLFYEREKFDESDPKYSSTIQDYIYQPDSKREKFGVKLGIKF
ncbi:MAG: hypothetical protein QXW80_05995 [Candidatus Micrarchaeia archaeon]